MSKEQKEITSRISSWRAAIKSYPKDRKRLKTHFLYGVIFILIFSAGTYTGAWYQQKNNGNGVDMSEFWQAYNLIHQKYVGNVDNSKLVQGAISGMVNGLGDPFSQFLPPDDNTSLNTELSGQFEGIGAELISKNNNITVMSALSNTPAEKAGIKSGDIVVKIDDATTEGMSLNTAVSKIRGVAGSTVKLTVLHVGDTQTTDITITRQQITVPSVTSKMIGSVGYIEVSQFGADTVDGFTQAVNTLTPHNPKAMIIDLRDDPGGYLNDVAPMAGEFLPPSVIVKEKYKDGQEDSLSSTKTPSMPSVPVYILINGGSASAAEIFTGALQDYKRATVIGEQSFGKGSVQELVNMPGGSALRITIAEWYTPKDRTINKVGITPDVVVKDAKTDSSDPILEKALSLANQ